MFVVVQSLSCVRLFLDPMDCIVCQAPLSMGFPRQEYWSKLPFPSPKRMFTGIIIILRVQVVPTVPPFSKSPSAISLAFLLDIQAISFVLCIFTCHYSSFKDNANKTWFAVSSQVIGEGHGNPLQYSCLENPVDGGAWQAAVRRVAQRHD